LEREDKAVEAEEEERWIPLFVSDFEGLTLGNVEKSGWSNYKLVAEKEGCPWDLVEVNSKENSALYVKEPEAGRNCWLYTGKGTMECPPSSFGDKVLTDVNVEGHSGSYRIIATVKGHGAADFYIWWFDKKGKRKKKHIGRYCLPEEYRSLKKRFELPKEAKEFRVVLRLRKDDKGESDLYMDYFRVERAESNSTAN